MKKDTFFGGGGFELNGLESQAYAVTQQEQRAAIQGCRFCSSSQWDAFAMYLSRHGLFLEYFFKM